VADDVRALATLLHALRTALVGEGLLTVHLNQQVIEENSANKFRK